MTKTEAHNKLKEILSHTFSENLPEGRKRNEALKMSIQAMEMQMPKEAILTIYETDGEESEVFGCPVCGYGDEGQQPNYCPSCGQALKYA